MWLGNFGLAGGNRKTLVVLGAGASRGASFVKDLSLPLPPLDLDFFQQLARMPSSDESRHLLEFLRSEYPNEVGLSMEQFFSEADYTDKFHHELKLDRGPYVRKYQRALESFYAILPRMLEATTSSQCEQHAVLASLLYAQDCVLSFNYDCIMDRALRDHANRSWDPDKNGYGFAPAGNGDLWRKHTGKGRPVARSLRLLKMHGSLNWERQPKGAISLVSDTSAVSSLRGVIIPPTWFKNLTQFPFADIWKTARHEIRTSRIMVVIGYSVPQTDLFSRSLFKVEAGSKVRREQLDLLVLVNPDERARRRFLDLIGGGVEPSTTILEYATLSDLGALFKRNVLA
jgi:hypothetical protein